VSELTEQEFQQLYGRWPPLVPQEAAKLLDGAPFRWWIAEPRGFAAAAAAWRRAES
jgi:hypothetical protein